MRDYVSFKSFCLKEKVRKLRNCNSQQFFYTVLQDFISKFEKSLTSDTTVHLIKMLIFINLNLIVFFLSQWYLK